MFATSWDSNVSDRTLVRRVVILNQLQPLYAGKSVLADDDVILHEDAERAGDVDNLDVSNTNAASET